MLNVQSSKSWHSWLITFFGGGCFLFETGPPTALNDLKLAIGKMVFLWSYFSLLNHEGVYKVRISSQFQLRDLLGNNSVF